jgi:hypothetical protein
MDCRRTSVLFVFWYHSPNILNTHTYTVACLWTSDLLFAEATHTTHNKHHRWTSKPSAGFKPAIPAMKRIQIYALDRMAAGINSLYKIHTQLLSAVYPLSFNTLSPLTAFSDN